MLPTPATQIFRTSLTPAEIQHAIRERFTVSVEVPRSSTTTWADTFDGRLDGAERILALDRPQDGEPGTLRLQDASSGTFLLGVPARELPDFPEDVASESCREVLKPLVGIRRLLPLATRAARIEEVRVLDGESKTVARLILESGTVEGLDGQSAEWPTLLHLREVRGYPEDYRMVGRFLEKDLEIEPEPRSELSLALEALGAPDRLRPRPKIALLAEEEAASAMRRLLVDLREIVLLNEDGVRHDLDTEFLHDLRVAVRRARSLLSQVRDVLPPAATKDLRGELKWIQQATGPLRDLDVHLLKLPTLRRELPEEHRRDLDPLERYLHRHRNDELAAVVTALDSPRYAAALEAWTRLAEDKVEEQDGPLGREAIGPLAARRILKAWKRILKKGGRIREGTEASALHSLRIDGKKLRYLLELFGGMWPTRDVKPLVKALKKLQDNLGDFQDFEVQQDKLLEIAEGMLADGDAPPSALLALGRLSATLQEGQERERRRFAAIFGKFTTPHRIAAFRELFGRPA